MAAVVEVPQGCLDELNATVALRVTWLARVYEEPDHV